MSLTVRQDDEGVPRACGGTGKLGCWWAEREANLGPVISQPMAPAASACKTELVTRQGCVPLQIPALARVRQGDLL